MQDGSQTYFQAQLIAEELARLGIRHVCLSPGSRCTPLTTAVARHPQLTTSLHVDERAAAYYAQGYARASGCPAPLICTSGTAVANYLPAVIEASQDRVPMLLLTADRPPELRQNEANQTIDQVKLFADYVRWQVDLPCAADTMPPEALLTSVDQAVFASLQAPAGPVHINVQIRKPFLPETLPDAPDFAWPDARNPFTRRWPPVRQPVPAAIAEAATLLNGAKRGLVVVGSLATEQEREGVTALLNHLQWPYLADIRSGLRLGNTDRRHIAFHELLIQHQGFREDCRPDVILQVGGRLVSSRLPVVLRDWQCPRLMVQNHPQRDNPLHQPGLILDGDFSETCEALTKAVAPASAKRWCETLAEWQSRAETAWPGGWHEGAACRLLASLLPAGHGLYLAASLPVRDLQLAASPGGERPLIAANRGASGIDGTLSSAVGFARGCEQPVTLVMGDLAALHDLNSLAVLAQSPVPVIVVILNNGGGGIFHLLPVSQQTSVFRDYFVTPHDYTFARAAEMFELQYRAIGNAEALQAAYEEALASGHSAVLEVRTGECDYPQLVDAWLRQLG